MIEETIRSFLAERLDVPVRLSVPTPAPARFVVVEKTGSGYEDGIFTATLAVQSYGSSDYAAAQLSHRVVQTMLDADTLPEIVSCTLNTDYNFPDTTRKLPRYQAVFEVVHY